ncbi:hypothetical protein TYRP_000608 [Tyrophagus putrescentiae]|nr:hypothetical protein TYRP_000608 [Tyrophagus putrescentiae]
MNNLKRQIKEIRSPSPEPPVVTVKLPPKHAIAKAKSTEEKRPLDTTAKPPTEPVIKHAKTVTFAADQSSTTKELPKSDAISKPEVVKPKVVKKKEVTKKKAETESKLAPVTDDVTATKQQDELTKTETETKVEQPKKRRSKKKLRFREYTVDDFTFLAVLGRGSFGKVLLAEVKGHNVCFAVKCLKKQTIIVDDDVESIMIERKVLAFGSSNPFICKLFCTFQTESHLFFAMELCSGGDLMFHVQKEGKFSEEKSRFYACEILCALWFMHKRSIIYRDLKLDNIMIYQDGHIRLVDFGMCQGKMYREELLPCNFCGTPEYMAPEIVQGVKYNHSVDYWALGVVIYEMVVGTSPFHGTDEDELLWNVCHQDVHYPRHLSDNVRDLIVLLLKRNPNERLGVDTSLGNIESQPWFSGVNWRRYEECKMQPPFVPELNNDTDVSYFDRYFTKEKPVISSTASSPISEKDQLMFEGFNYTNHNMTI